MDTRATCSNKQQRICAGKSKTIRLKMTKEKGVKNNDLRCLKMQKNGALRKKPSSESYGDTWWMIWKQMGCKTVEDKSTT